MNLDVRIAFNPNLTTAWFTGVMAVTNNVTMLTIILAGAAVVRERQHGTMDHLLVMPLTPFEIAMSGLLSTLVYLPLNMLSGGNTPLESMPLWLARFMQVSPSTHFVAFAQSILYRGAGLYVVWPQFLAIALIGALFFGLAMLRFRSVAAQAA
jgi:ABC-2 type transport system permease protein